ICMNTQAPLLELQDVKATCGINKLEIFSMKVYSGVCYQITGVNGSGKSLLMKILAHEKGISKGDILYDGKSLNKGEYSKSNLVDKISFVEQEKPFWISKSVISYLQASIKNKTTAIAWQEAMTLLEKFDLKIYSDIKRSKLSRGLYKKVELLRLLLEDKDIMILDDPYSGLDEFFIKKFNGYIRTMVKNEKKTVVVSHSGSLSRFRLIDVLLVLNKGRIVKVEKPQFRSGGSGNSPRKYTKRTQ
ncbi:ATP-binding cassette domain-containing protein, partial [bacterium]|nr:ATP-binding cassette domain-containing protein [bacterium]